MGMFNDPNTHDEPQCPPMAQVLVTGVYFNAMTPKAFQT